MKMEGKQDRAEKLAELDALKRIRFSKSKRPSSD